MNGSRRISLSGEATEYLNRLYIRVQSKCEKSSIYKIAFAKGLMSSHNNLLVDFKSDSKGSEIRIDSIENIIFDAAIRQKFKVASLNNKGRYYKLLIDYGALLLEQEDEGDEEKLIIEQYKNNKVLMTFNKSDKLFQKRFNPISNIILELGEYNENSISITWNDKDHTGQHIGITGKTGAGKTQFALEIISQIKEQNESMNIIFFDYAKGDVAANKKFSSLIGANIIDLANDGIPYNPFFMEDVNDQKIEELKEIFTSIQKRIGPKQSLDLFDIFQKAYEKYEEPDLSLIYQLMIQIYDEQGKNKDVLVELFHKLNIPRIFPDYNNQNLFRTLSDKNIIFDLHNIDSHMKVKELVTFLILNKIYMESIRLPDSKINEKTGMREMRTLVVIDEAHNYLDANNRILERMLRELRSKGVAVVLLSQGFDDLVQKQFDYSSMLNWIFLMKSDNSIQGIEKSLAIPKDVASKVTNELATVETGIVYTRKLSVNDKLITKFHSKAFWKRN
ncbi:type IV secretion system DNA-binding domain-containing protein [Lysinibacillus sp. NPDC096212]|uniref:type IV secretion system DNA-binding domain-containing protein n=1 Tax=Lysinibacillus sp. NPDC096212 TaxID=3364135 RepID=UPI0038179A6F